MAEAELIRAQHYHEQAQRLNALAAGEKKESLRAKLLELAAQYEQSCRRIVSRRPEDAAHGSPSLMPN